MDSKNGNIFGLLAIIHTEYGRGKGERERGRGERGREREREGGEREGKRGRLTQNFVQTYTHLDTVV